MVFKNRLKLSLLLLLFIIVITTIFGFVQTKQFSAYAVCREEAMNTKGYAVWQHERTIPLVFLSQVIFSDGINDLSCQAVGIGPFWSVRWSIHTLAGCALSLAEDGADMCPEDYFGVSP